MEPIRIGVDFDNTIVSYEGVFYKAALEKSLIPPELSSSKGVIRDYLRSLGKEGAWTELQGYVYGAKMDLAHPYEGVDEFFSFCCQTKIPVCVISHKTKRPFLGPPYDLHKSAAAWMERYPFSRNLPSFFELTLQAKFNRMVQERCTLFIDDLPELLQSVEFPPGIQKMLFDPHRLHAPSSSYEYATNWNEVTQFVRKWDARA